MPGIFSFVKPNALFQGPLDRALDLVFPPHCVACGAPLHEAGLHLCATCDAALQIDKAARCSRCAQRCSPADLPLGNCGECRGRKTLFSAARTIGSHEGLLREAVLKAKHAFYEPLAAALGRRLAVAISQSPFPQRPELVVPVPMHWWRRLTRKTHPACTIARSLAGELAIPLATQVLVCRRPLRPQSSLSAPQRRQNVHGAFRVRSKRVIQGRCVLLVDDVMTTGATAREATRVLLQAGANSVLVATVARSSSDV